jgi:hypothetical protein
MFVGSLMYVAVAELLLGTVCTLNGTLVAALRGVSMFFFLLYNRKGKDIFRGGAEMADNNNIQRTGS